MPNHFQTKTGKFGLTDMNKDENQNEKLPVEGQDFAKPAEEQEKKPSSHGEVANQKEGDFSELEESRMEHPPKHREENGSGKDDVDSDTKINQGKGVK
ncbi:hypothetical protein [Pedobacter miscanthi]|jgi:hypothetical protein|uniref:hypothetical protein n=1 Tax=Pedobacter miscanthi TaxID=2259170 RepID=UPI002930B965|nr:hypothetical protein [Pedobacter miscanthi]